MSRRRSEDDDERRHRPPTSPEGREQELASHAYDLAEKQIKAGTASSQVITHFLKVGSRREVLEQQRIEHEIEMSRIKAEAIQSQARVEELYLAAMDAMKSYRGELDAGGELEDN